jgi:hypothetical protein
LRSGTRRAGAGLGRDAAVTHALLLLAPVVTLVLLVRFATHREFAVDFSCEYWVAARRLLDGGDLYSWTAAQIRTGVAFPYPATTALALAPVGLLSRTAASAVFTALSMAAVVAALRALAVRDRRVYAICFLMWPVINGWQVANLTLVLLLLIALVWRHRQNIRWE